jgi:putative transposase
MPRPHRLDFRGAIHYVRVRGVEGASVFFDAQVLKDLSGNPRCSGVGLLEFERLVAEVGAECGSRLYGYSVLPNSAMLVVQAAGAALEALMQRLCGQYSRHWHGQARRSPSAGAKAARVFSGRYESKVLSPEYVPHAVRRAHLRPVQAGLCTRAVDYPFGSAAAYFGRPARVPLDLSAATGALQGRGLVGLKGYREFMEQPETAFVANLFERGCVFDSRVIGNKVFVMQARQRAAHPPPVPSREQLIAAVAQLIHCEPAELYSSSHTGVLGRSLVAWYGMRAGAATLKQIGEWFSVSGATLGQGIRHYRGAAPAWFALRALPGLRFYSGTEFGGEG